MKRNVKGRVGKETTTKTIFIKNSSLFGEFHLQSKQLSWALNA